MSIYAAGICCRKCYESEGNEKINWQLEAMKQLREFQRSEIIAISADDPYSEDISDVVDVVVLLSDQCFLCKGDYPIIYLRVKENIEEAMAQQCGQKTRILSLVKK